MKVKKIILTLILCFYGVLNAQNLNISTGLVFEGEPFIAINPNNNQHLVVAWMGFKLGQEIVIKTKETV
ncbi:MAG: hypothetical protein R3277_09815 [Brumimicrobium sp.]|nr:hypothetical protein [Brumimicrobium sp.]